MSTIQLHSAPEQGDYILVYRDGTIASTSRTGSRHGGGKPALRTGAQPYERGLPVYVADAREFAADWLAVGWRHETDSGAWGRGEVRASADLLAVSAPARASATEAEDRAALSSSPGRYGA